MIQTSFVDFNELLTTYNKVAVRVGIEVKFFIEIRHRYGCTVRPRLYEHTGRVVCLTQSGDGVVLEGVDIPGRYSRRFEDIPDFQNPVGPLPTIYQIEEAGKVVEAVV